MKDEQQAERPNRFSISFMGFQTNQSASHPAIQPSVVLASGGQWPSRLEVWVPRGSCNCQLVPQIVRKLN